MTAPSSFTFLTTPFILSSNSKPIFYLTVPIAATHFHASHKRRHSPQYWPYRQTPALSAPVESPGEINRSVQCANCSFWMHLSCSGLLLIFEKFFQDTLGLVRCPHLSLKLSNSRQRLQVVKAPVSCSTRSRFKTYSCHSVVLGNTLNGTFPYLVVLASSSNCLQLLLLLIYEINFKMLLIMIK